MTPILLALLLSGAPESRATTTKCDAEARLAGPKSMLDRWQEAVRRRELKKTKLPYAMSTAYTARFLRLPYDLPEFADTRIYLTYFDRPFSIAPVWRQVESWHAIVKYLEGYNYVVSFPSEDARKSFLKRFSIVQIPEGELEGRFTLLLTPAQFSAASEAVIIRGSSLVRDGLRPSTRRELESLGWSPLSRSTSGLRYFFDDRGAVVGLRQGRNFYAVESRSAERARAAASHLEILKAQNRSLDLGRFLSTRGTVPGDFGLAQANLELDRLEAAIERRQELSDSESDVLKASSLGPLAGGFALARLINYRFEALKHIENSNDRDIAADVTRDRSLVCSGPPESTQVLRFAWVKDLDLGAGLLLGRRARLMHHQMVALVTGRAVLEKLVSVDGVRGGTLAITFDRQGKPEAFRVDSGLMRSLGPEGRVREIQMSSGERQMLALALFNYCQQHLRNPKL